MIKAHYKMLNKELEQEYIRLIKNTLIDDCDRKFLMLYKKMNITAIQNIDEILIADFNKLCLIADQYEQNKNKLKKQDITNLKMIFNYGYYKFTKNTKLANAIQNFFERYVSNNTCYYCNLEYTNSFVHEIIYNDVNEFINKANSDLLFSIPEFNHHDVNVIVKSRKSKLITLADLSPDIQSKINNVPIEQICNNYRNQFTLDHIIDKATYEITAISLYNLVPTCFTCNCKLKGSKSYIDMAKSNTYKVSPTHINHSFNKEMKFNICYKNNGQTVTTNFSNVLVGSNNHKITLQETTFTNNVYDDFIKLMKLNERYNYHISDALDLLEKKISYPDSTLNMISKTTGMPINKLKSDLFGKEIFSGELHEKIMTKFKRDIAKQIGII